MTKPKQQREWKVMKGWTFSVPVHARNYTACRPFFRFQREAEEVAASFADPRVKAIPATLTLSKPPRRKAK